MRQFFNWDGPLFACLNKLGKSILVSLLLLFVSLPVVTWGLAYTAAYYLTVKCIRYERGNFFQEALAVLKREWKKTCLFSVIYLIAFFILGLDVYVWFCHQTKAGMAGALICAVLGLMLAGSALYLFPVISRFDLTFADTLKLSFFLSLRYLPTTLCLLFIAGTAGLLIYLSVYFALVVPGLAIWLISVLMEKIMIRMTPEPAQGEEQWFDGEKKEEEDAE